jgi:RNA polymerase sigma factor (sigma-70 family)
MRTWAARRAAGPGVRMSFSAITPVPATLEAPLSDARALDRFLASIERRAFRAARLMLGDADDALDAVQDAMLKLATSYAARPESEWTPLFWTILRSRVTDLRRRRVVRNRVLVWFGGARDDEAGWDPISDAADPAGDPETQLVAAESLATLEAAVARLPTRQREAFVLRVLEGLDVADTARAMGCSQGSDKTHLSRAMQALRGALEDA